MAPASENIWYSEYIVRFLKEISSFFLLLLLRLFFSSFFTIFLLPPCHVTDRSRDASIDYLHAIKYYLSEKKSNK